MFTRRIKQLTLRLSSRSRSARPAFIFGAQRSGTNMLLAALSRCRRVECYNESDDVAFDNYRIKNADSIKRLIAKSGARVVVFKPICDSQHARKMLDTFEPARAIWIYRHYHDVVNSSLRHFREHREYLRYMLLDPAKAAWRLENVSTSDLALVKRFDDEEISDASARALIWYLRNVQFIQQKLDVDSRIRLTSYENLVTNPNEELASVCAHLGVDFSERMARPFFATSVGRQSPPEIHPEISALCEGVLEHLTAIRRQESPSSSLANGATARTPCASPSNGDRGGQTLSVSTVDESSV